MINDCTAWHAHSAPLRPGRPRQADLRRLLVRQHRQHHRVPADRRRARAPAAARLLRRQPIRSPQKIVTFFVDSFGWQFWQQHGDRFRTTRACHGEGHADADLGAVSLHHRGVGLHAEPRRAAERARALRVEHLHPRLRRGDPVARLHSARAAHAQDACLQKGYDPAQDAGGARDGAPAPRPARRALHPVREPQLRRLGLQPRRQRRRRGRPPRHAGGSAGAAQGGAASRHRTRPGSASTGRRSTPSPTSTGPAQPTTPPRSRASGTPSTPSSATSTAPTRSTCSPPITARSMPTPSETIYINERFPELADCLPVSPTGNPIYPNGSPRDVFLHVRPERRDEVLDTAAPGSRRHRAGHADGDGAGSRACSARRPSAPSCAAGWAIS